MRRNRAALIALVAGGILQAGAHAQQYPVKPVRLIVAYAAGGGTDTVARVFAQKLSEGLGRQVVVDNRPGGGNIATELAVKSVADYLTHQHRIDGQRLSVEGFGRSQLLDPANPASAVNRRVQITNLGS